MGYELDHLFVCTEHHGAERETAHFQSRTPELRVRHAVGQSLGGGPTRAMRGM